MGKRSGEAPEGNSEGGLKAPPRLHEKRRHIPELDGVRGVAVILVLMLHGFAWSMETEKWTGLARWVELATRPGWMGVDLFFVLSGFLITGILLDSAGKPHYFRNFYARRALRILPLYYGFLILIAICYRGAHDYVFLSAFYLSNMAPILGVAVYYGPLWSLSVEEHFYLLWPWLISRLKTRHIWVLAGSICVIEPVLRGIAYFEGWELQRIPGSALMGWRLELFSRCLSGLPGTRKSGFGIWGCPASPAQLFWRWADFRWASIPGSGLLAMPCCSRSAPYCLPA